MEDGGSPWGITKELHNGQDRENSNVREGYLRSAKGSVSQHSPNKIKNNNNRQSIDNNQVVEVKTADGLHRSQPARGVGQRLVDGRVEEWVG